ncbi:UPF0172-domain-containing protein [Hymenopellis radicata]|nr:UPF0172-domain-containing protein [Hymenopellis radicata]
MATYTISDTAYFKIFFHAAKHPHAAVNGVLVGKQAADGVEVVDVVPLLHHWTSLSPMMEIGLDLAGRHAASLDLKLVGYYQACERIDDAALAPVGEKVASKIRDTFQNAIALVIDGTKLGAGDAGLIPYVAQGSTWRPHAQASSAYSPGSPFQLASPDLPTRAVALVKEKKLEEKFGDFDDHLENVTIDWLRNPHCLPANL